MRLFINMVDKFAKKTSKTKSLEVKYWFCAHFWSLFLASLLIFILIIILLVSKFFDL